MEYFKWGVLGPAKIATEKVIPAIQSSRLGRVHALASRDAARAARVAQQLGIPVSHGSYQALLDDPVIDGVYIPLPNHLHVEMTLAAIAAGKPVLCEKPIALHADDFRRLIAARDQHHLPIMEAFMVRSHPQWQVALDRLYAGDIGQLRHLHCHFSYYNDDANNIRNQADIGGGALRDIGCYGLISARTLFGSEPRRVVALVERDPAFKTDRLTSCLLEFDQGQATVTASTQLVPHQSVQVFGTRGRIEITIPFNAPTDTRTLLYIDDGSQTAGQSRREIVIDVVNQYSEQADAFVRTCRGESPPPMTLEDSWANQRVLDAVFESERCGGWVTLSPV